MNDSERLDKLTRDGITIYKRYAGPDAVYYTRFRVQGKHQTFSLSANADKSFKQARQLKRTARERRFDVLNQVKQRPDNIKLEKIHAAYLTSPSDAGPDTRRQNLNALKQITIASGGSPLTLVSELTPQLARKWFEQASTAAQEILAQGGPTAQQAAASVKRSANSRWSQAASVFTAKCLQYYKDQDLFDERITAFLAAGEAAKFTGRSIPKISYNPPSDEIITATLRDWAELGNHDSSKDLFLAIGHELAFGLRAQELTQAVWGWWTVRAGYPVLDGQAAVKSGTGLIQVRALDPWFSTMRTKIETNHWRGQDDEYIIPGTDTYRSEGIFRAVSDWLRNRGWETQKTNHALRAYAGSQIAMKYGIYDAQSWLRHSTVKVTEQHYSHFVVRFKPADLETIPARWATTAREFKPQIVPLPEAVAGA